MGNLLRIALIRGPYLRPSGIAPWIDLHNNHDDMHVTAFESIPSRFNTDHIGLPIEGLHWLDGKVTLFGQQYIFSKAFKKLCLPSDVLLGLSRVVRDYDIIHTSENSFMFSLQSAFLCSVFKKPFVFTAGQNINYPWHYVNPLMWLTKKYLNRSAKFITTTTIMGKRALIHEGVTPKKIHILPNAVDLNHFRSEHKCPEKLGMPSYLKETFNIAFSHKLCEQKGTYFLIDAFFRLHQKIPLLKLILLGENLLNENYSRLVKEAEDIFHIRSLPYSKMNLFYNLADIVVLPSITMPRSEEQFGMAIIEAMACGKATIVTDVGGMPYIVKDKETSLVINERSSQAIVSAVYQLWDNKSFRQQLGKNARQYVRRNFSIKTIGKKLYELYSKIREANSK